MEHNLDEEIRCLRIENVQFKKFADGRIYKVQSSGQTLKEATGTLVLAFVEQLVDLKKIIFFLSFLFFV